MPSNAEKMTSGLQRTTDQQFAVQSHNVIKNFGSILGLDNAKLGTHTDEIAVLLGLSGPGKTTLFRHTNALHTSLSGTVRVLGQNLNALKKHELRELRRDIGVIFQSLNLVGRMSVLENVCTGVLGDLKGPRISLLSHLKWAKQEALEMLGRVGLVDRAHQRADMLSGGQQQRAAITCALMQHPEILLADEPVVALDSVSSNQVIELLEQTSREDSLITTSSLHQVQLAVDFADRIIDLQAGRMKFGRKTRGMAAETAVVIYQSVSEATKGVAISASLKAEA